MTPEIGCLHPWRSLAPRVRVTTLPFASVSIGIFLFFFWKGGVSLALFGKGQGMHLDILPLITLRLMVTSAKSTFPGG